MKADRTSSSDWKPARHHTPRQHASRHGHGHGRPWWSRTDVCAVGAAQPSSVGGVSVDGEGEGRQLHRTTTVETVERDPAPSTPQPISTRQPGPAPARRTTTRKFQTPPWPPRGTHRAYESLAASPAADSVGSSRALALSPPPLCLALPSPACLRVHRPSLMPCLAPAISPGHPDTGAR